MEETVEVPGIFAGTETVQVTALGRSKAAHEFLVLHYFGLDSAKHWDALLLDVLPTARFAGASARRAIALEMFGASHIAPSHRRMPFFCSTLLRCDLHKKKVPGRTPYSQHIMIRNWT